jgi:putative hydrolase of the HAD superfamily
LPDSSIRAIFFDFGGVLLQHMDGIDHKAIEARLGLEERTLMRVLYRDSRYLDYQVGACTEAEWIESIRVAAETHTGELAPAVMKAWQDAENDLNPHMIDLVKALHGRYTLGIISNTIPGMEQRLQDKWPWLPGYFDVRIGSGDLSIAKPDPQIFQHAASLAGVEPAHAVFTDDAAAYAEAARGTGMHGFHFTGFDQFAADLRSIGVEW